MNVENFSDFIKHPANLYRINYQELKSLVLQYPNALNLRILLLLKSKIENHPEFDKNLKAAATYAIDRSRIYDLLENPELQLDQLNGVSIDNGAVAIDLNPESETKTSENQPERVEEHPDYSWLEQPVENMEAIASTINDVEKEFKTVPPKEKTVSTPGVMEASVFEKYLEHLGSFYGGVLISELNEEVDHTAVLEEKEPETETLSSKRPEQMKNLKKLQKHKGIAEEKEEISQPLTEELEEGVVPMPLPREAFESYHQKAENFEIEFDALEQIVFNAVKEEEEKKESQKKEKSEAEILAKRSLKLKTGIVSETLAELLVKQENYEQAIEMYEQLILKYPEKSAFFALQIENLKKL